VEVQEADTPQSLQKRVMEQAEWIILPRAINLIGAGRVRIEDGIAHIR
jgi:phosphoribosylglycinamide formyltransferase-1